MAANSLKEGLAVELIGNLQIDTLRIQQAQQKTLRPGALEPQPLCSLQAAVELVLALRQVYLPAPRRH